MRPDNGVPPVRSSWTAFRFAAVLLCLPGTLLLPFAVYDIHRRFDKPGAVAFAGAVLGMIAVVAVLEAGLRFTGELWQEGLRGWPTGKPIPPNLAAVFWWAIVLHAQFMGLAAFLTTLDGGLRWAAARWVYLGYAVPALALAVARWRRWTVPERLFLRWGWAPVLAFGVPVALPRLLAAGLISNPWD
jgi:hypothetical protein